jgi:hypothetical protein
MEFTTNQIVINVILSSFAYAYILDQLKVFLLTTRNPIENIRWEWAEDRDDIPNGTSTGLGLYFAFLIGSFAYYETDDNGARLACIIVSFFFLLISIIQCGVRYTHYLNKEKKYFLGDTAHFLVFIAFLLVYCFTRQWDLELNAERAALRQKNIIHFIWDIEAKAWREKPLPKSFFDKIWWSCNVSLLTYVLARGLLYGAKHIPYTIRIIFVIASLVLCMSGKYSILGWNLDIDVILHNLFNP